MFGIIYIIISTHTNHELGEQECRHLPQPQSVKIDRVTVCNGSVNGKDNNRE